MQARRQVLKFGLMAMGAAFLPGQVLADTGPRRIAFHNLHTDEKVDAIYFDNDTNTPEWAAVKSGLFGSHVTLVRKRNRMASLPATYSARVSGFDR